MPEKIKINGIIQKKLLNKGSKSEYTGYSLVSQENSYQLRQLGSNPFGQNDEIEKFLNKVVSVEGLLENNVLFIQKIKSGNSEKKVKLKK